MDPVPRDHDLDRLLATEGHSDGVLEVYADWLLQQGHGSLAEILADARLAAAGDRDASRRLLEAKASVGGQSGSVTMSWSGGLVEGLEVSPDRTWSSWDATGSFADAVFDPRCALLTSVRVELSEESDVNGYLLSLLSDLPPSVGQLVINDARAPQAGAPIDLGGVALPHLWDLRIRAGGVSRWPESLASLRHLELGVADADPLRGLSLPELTTLHLWIGIGRQALGALTVVAPRLSRLGLHGAGAIEPVLGWPLPDSVRELVLGLQPPEPGALAALVAQVPADLQAIWLPRAGSEALPAPFVAGAPDPQPPIYL